MSKKKIEQLDALIFIDTNIFLDFYRIRRNDISLEYLQQIEEHKDLIITSSQIEMEFKKNRQITILESMGEVKKINNINITVPAIVSDAKSVDMIRSSKKVIEEHQKKLKKKIENILTDPSKYDIVYKSLQNLFSNKSHVNLNRDNDLRFTIRRLALKRFMLGYPPRKANENSIGDAINWEWIIKCAENSNKHVIVVTRDTDYGAIYDNESFLNDWLVQEFKQRISKRRKLILTDKLTKAFQMVQIPVTKEMIEEEEIIIGSGVPMDLTYKDWSKKLQEEFKKINETNYLE